MREIEDRPTVQEVLQEHCLSWKAKALLLYLMEFGHSLREMQERSHDGLDAIRSGIRELKQAGIISVHPSRNRGRMTASEVVVTWNKRFHRKDPPIMTNEPPLFGQPDEEELGLLVDVCDKKKKHSHE